MKKLTPKDVLSCGLNTGNFNQEEAKRHKVCEKIDYEFRSINIKHFGDIFLKCVGDINSILKRGVSQSGHIQRVVKKQIGIRTIDPDNTSNNPTGNAKYAKKSQIYAMLHPEHVKLACKRAKREMLEDFYAVKEQMIMKFQNMKVLAMDYVDDQITVSDAFCVGHKSPCGGNYEYREMGYMLLNARAVPRDNVYITINDNSQFFGSYDLGVEKALSGWYRGDRPESLVFKAFIREPRPMADGDTEVTYENTKLFTCTVQTNRYSEPVKVEVYDTKFDGIDITGMAKALGQELNSFAETFNEAIEEVKMKYHGEFLLHEICTTDGAI